MIAQPVAIAGVNVATFVGGSSAADAPVLVLVHGIGHWAEGAWLRLAAEVDPVWRIIAFDLPGFGASAKPQRTYDLPFFRTILAGVLDACGAGSVVLVGHSLGGMIAADFAAAYPARVTALVLCAPAGMLRAPRMILRVFAGRFARALFTVRPPRALIERTLRNAVYDPAAIDAATFERAVTMSADPDVRFAFASVYAGALVALLDTRGLHRRFATYTGPVVIAWGENDNYTPIRGLRTALRIYPHAAVLRLPATGHALMLERPSEIAHAIDALLTSRPS